MQDFAGALLGHDPQSTSTHLAAVLLNGPSLERVGWPVPGAGDKCYAFNGVAATDRK